MSDKKRIEDASLRDLIQSVRRALFELSALYSLPITPDWIHRLKHELRITGYRYEMPGAEICLREARGALGVLRGISDQGPEHGAEVYALTRCLQDLVAKAEQEVERERDSEEPQTEEVQKTGMDRDLMEQILSMLESWGEENFQRIVNNEKDQERFREAYRDARSGIRDMLWILNRYREDRDE